MSVRPGQKRRINSEEEFEQIDTTSTSLANKKKTRSSTSSPSPRRSPGRRGQTFEEEELKVCLHFSILSHFFDTIAFFQYFPLFQNLILTYTFKELLYGIYQGTNNNELAMLYLDQFPMSGRTKQSVKGKIQNLKIELFKKLSSKATSTELEPGFVSPPIN